MIRTFYRSGKGNTTVDLPQTSWAAALKDTGGLLWVDIATEPGERVTPILRDVFGFHPLTVNDAIEERIEPRLQAWERYLYVSAHEVAFPPDGLSIATFEVDAFLGANFLVTHHNHTSAAVDEVWRMTKTGASAISCRSPTSNWPAPTSNSRNSSMPTRPAWCATKPCSESCRRCSIRYRFPSSASTMPA